jgi:hypothetical protein
MTVPTAQVRGRRQEMGARGLPGRSLRGIWAFRGVLSGTLALLAVVSTTLVPTGAGGSSPADLGVTAKTIKFGVVVIDFAALKSVGYTLNDGNFPDAFTAIADYMNAHGGVDGRKLVPYFVETNPASSTSENTGCTALTEDDHVFIAMFPVYPDCYQVNHDTPVIGGGLPGAIPAGAAPDFNIEPPNTVYDAVQLAAFAKLGAFKEKKVGIFYGADSATSEEPVVAQDLKKLHVRVVAAAEDDAPTSDEAAQDAQAKIITVKFQNLGVNEVVAVSGIGATVYPRALLDNQSTFKPPWLATDYTDLLATAESAKRGNPYLDNVMASTPIAAFSSGWRDPAMQKCVHIVKTAYPSDTIGSPPPPNEPVTTADSQNTPYLAVYVACQDLALFAKIADTAGKNLNLATFTEAAHGLRNIAIPGAGTVSFAPGQTYAQGKAHVVVYDAKTGNLVPLPVKR